MRAFWAVSGVRRTARQCRAFGPCPCRTSAAGHPKIYQGNKYRLRATSTPSRWEQKKTVLFCRACGFRVRVWDFPKFRVRMLPTSRKFRCGGTFVQNSQTFRAGTINVVPVRRVLWHGAYRTQRSSGYGCECPTELTEVPGPGMKVFQNFQKFRVCLLYTSPSPRD